MQHGARHTVYSLARVVITLLLMSRTRSGERSQEFLVLPVQTRLT